MTLSAKQAVEKSLLTLGAPHVVTTQDLNAYAEFETGARPAPATVTRMANALAKTGALQRVSRTVYLNKLAGPTIQLAEAAQYIRRGAVASLAWVLERSGALNNYGDVVTCVVTAVQANGIEVKVGDVLQNSGVDGIYPPGLDVAKVVKVDPRADSSFARIALVPTASADGVRHVLVLEPMAMQLPARPAPEPEPAKDKKPAKGAKK